VDCWGENGNGQADDQPGPYTQVSAGITHTCALTPAGAVDCWGYNDFGQADDQPGPYTQVSADITHTCALTAAGALDCWGDNFYGQAGDQPGPYSQVSIGIFHTCALTPAGAVDCWGNNGEGQAAGQTGPYGPYHPPPLPQIVSAGAYHNCGLTPVGAVDCWGYNNNGQAADQTGPYTQVSAGGFHNCALTPAGAVDCWGWDFYGQAADQTGPYTQVSAGSRHNCALTPAGAVDCWGDNSDGQAAGQSGPYTQVSTGLSHTCALTPAGAVDCWGLDDNGETAGQSGPYTQVSAGFYYTCALTPAGAVDCWGKNDNGQAVDKIGPYTQVSAGGSHTCALTGIGAVDCWGLNDNNQALDWRGPYSQVSAGGWHTCALTSPYPAQVARVAHCWGDTSRGQGISQPGPYGPFVPQTTITLAPPALTNNNDASFEFFSDVFSAMFECRLDGGDWAACYSPSYTDLSDGSHTFEVRAVSPPGNPDTTPASHTWTIDTAAPVVTITSAPPDPSANADATFGFSSESGATLVCQLDGGGWTACTSPKSYTGLADGSHTFEVRATDVAGNTGPADSHTWTIDTTTPIYLSTTTTGSVGNLAYGPHDILLWDGTAWSKWFDGSAAGLMPSGRAVHNINSVWIPVASGNDAVFSFVQNARVLPGVPGKVNGMDLVWWNGSTFTLWFDGEDVGLTNMTKEKIDALHVLDGSLSPIGDGCLSYLLISTQGDGQVPNHSGGTLKFDGTDVLGFCMTNSGANTAGLWHRVLNGKAEGMPGQALTSLSASDDGQTLYLTTKGAFNVDSAVGGHSMVYEYDFASGEFSGPHFSAPAEGLNRQVDGLHVEGELP